MTDLSQPRRYRFGVFEADAGTGELRRQGLRIKLNVQPFQVLCMLLERPGELLTREEISRELWPEGTFVDYEHGVNSAVNRIRDALGDTARNPRFIETLARRGYRFVAPVQPIRGEDLAPAPEPPATPKPPILEPAILDPAITEPAILEPATASALPTPALSRFLAAPDDLPRTSHRTVQLLFLLLQLMYLGFYIGALANLPEIEELLAALTRTAVASTILTVTAALLIPVRVFLLTAVIFHAPGIRSRLLRLWPFLLPCDILWSLAPFLLLHHISFGLALGCVAPLVYAPFAQRSLILMGAGQSSAETRVN